MESGLVWDEEYAQIRDGNGAGNDFIVCGVGEPLRGFVPFKMLDHKVVAYHVVICCVQIDIVVNIVGFDKE